MMDALLHRQQKIENKDTAASEHKPITQHHDEKGFVLNLVNAVWFLWTWGKQELSSLPSILKTGVGSIVRPLNSCWPYKYSVPGTIA